MTSLLFMVPLAAAAAAPATPSTLWDAWPRERFVTTAAPCLDPEELAARIRDLAGRHADGLRVEQAGVSFEERPVHLLTVGRGPRKILLWSQMHGDEPSATPALLDVADWLLGHTDDPAARLVLDRLTLLIVPMLNPDGSARYVRRNAQAIDVNRDALNLATPEGRLLKELRDRHRPELGFNLHDQNRRTRAGPTGQLATISLLAVAGDPSGRETPGRRRAKRACAALRAALRPFVGEGIARYDEDWSPRAFGDNLTAWGTPVVLIESGGLRPGRPFTELTRLNFVALLRVLHDLARDDLRGHDPADYESLPRNETGSWADVVFRGGHVLQPHRPEPYRADVAFELEQDDRAVAGCPRSEPESSRITEVGDARFMGASRDVDTRGLVVAPAFRLAVSGLAARRWLDPDALDRLARLGVAEVLWHLAEADRGEAAAAADAARGPGRPAVVVAQGHASRVTLEAPPSEPASRSLGDTLTALLGAEWRALLGSADAGVRRLAGATAADGMASVTIAPDAEASFVLFRAPEGLLDSEHATLEAVWIRGREVVARE